MRRKLTARLLNGVVSALIVAFFIAHALLGSVGMLAGYTSPLAWLVWAGMVLVGVHVLVSIVTSVQQLTDAERPPSARKKRHLALKWATGCLLACAVIAHVLVMRHFGAAALQSSLSGAALGITLCVVLAVHICVGSKSLLKDLNIDRRYKNALRVAVCVLLGIVGIAIVGLAL